VNKLVSIGLKIDDFFSQEFGICYL